MMITELESPFTRRKKQKLQKMQENITIQEALRLTSKTMGLLGDEPEPDYGEDDLEPDYDDDEVNTGSYKLVNIDKHVQSSDGIIDFDQLDPQQIRRTMRHHFNETRRKNRRSTRRAFDADPDAEEDEFATRYSEFDRGNRNRTEDGYNEEDPDAEPSKKVSIQLKSCRM
jgi:hypothetical protein